MAREMVDAIAKRLGSTAKCITGKRHIQTAERSAAPGQPAISVGAALAHLAEAYGADSIRPLAYIEERPELGQPIAPGLPYLRAEAHYGTSTKWRSPFPMSSSAGHHVIYETPDAGLPKRQTWPGSWQKNSAGMQPSKNGR